MFKKSIFAMLAVSAALCLTVPAAAETFTASNGVLSIDLPNENWKEMTDPTRWIVLSDGGNMITVDHFSNGEKLPDMTVADDHYVNVYQAVFSTQNEVFIITGSLVDANAISDVCTAIMSAKVLQFDTKLAVKNATPAPQASEFTIVPVDKTMYVTSNGLNVRLACSSQEEIIGALAYGAAVKVTGVVQRNGADYGWYQIAYEQGSGYVSASFLSETEPEKKSETSSNPYTGKVRTVYEIDGHAVTLYEAKDGYWYDNEGHSYTWTSDSEIVAYNGATLTANKPQVNNDVTPVGDAVTVYYQNSNATTLTAYSDGYFYTPGWLRYESNGDGTFTGADGSTLFVNAPNLSGPAEEFMLYSAGSGRPVYIHHVGDRYYDDDDVDYFKRADGTFIDENGDVFGYTYTPSKGDYDPSAETGTYHLISRGSGRPVTIKEGGGAFYDEEGVEFHRQDDGTFIDSYDAVYDLDPAYK